MTDINEQLDKLQEAIDKDSTGPSWADRRHYVSDVYEDDAYLDRSYRSLSRWIIAPVMFLAIVGLFALIMWARS